MVNASLEMLWSSVIGEWLNIQPMGLVETSDHSQLLNSLYYPWAQVDDAGIQLLVVTIGPKAKGL